MSTCKKCGVFVFSTRSYVQCEQCRLNYKREWLRRKKNRICCYCQKSFIPKSIAKECSIKCKLLNRIIEINGCWEWQGKITNSGYGEISYDKKHRLAHRESYRIFSGVIPEGMQICHHCDNKKCINPKHLWCGTIIENMQDAKKKGRLPDQRGRKHTDEAREKMRLTHIGKPGYWTGKKRSEETKRKISLTKKMKKLK